ncbi:MAG: response regulator transcription factor [Thermodesulfovibrionales bacterium]|nr:response regulator transcription factor [Thermodesulfovibrionales bacterium]
MIRILIADDHKMFREGLKQVLEDAPDIVVADEAGSGQEVLDKVRKNDYDLLLLDISMPGVSGLDVLKELKADRSGPSILILSMYPEEQYALRAIKLGASGYITKSSASDELIQAIRKISKGGTYISSSIAEKLLFSIKGDSERLPHETLSNREYQILLMIASGKTISQIADELCLSIKTVSTYRARILEKMNMKTNAELIHYAIKHNLLN